MVFYHKFAVEKVHIVWYGIKPLLIPNTINSDQPDLYIKQTTKSCVYHLPQTEFNWVYFDAYNIYICSDHIHRTCGLYILQRTQLYSVCTRWYAHD